MFHLFLLLAIAVLERAYARCHAVFHVLVNETDPFLFLALKASPTLEPLLPGLNSLPLANPGEQTEMTGRPPLFYHLRLVSMITL